MRSIIAAMHVSVDGYVEGPDGALDWVESWEDAYDLLDRVDTFLLGGGMYPGYEQYWRSIVTAPEAVLLLTGRVATQREIEYAQFADTTPHIVLSTTLTETDWGVVRIVRDIEEIRALKNQPGKDIHAVGGARLVSSLMNSALLDELHLIVHPIVLAGGKALFGNVNERHALNLRSVDALESGLVSLVYGIGE